MNHAPRFYLPDLRVGEFALPDEEARHLTRALRLREGAAVELFDGSGKLGRGTVAAAGKREARVRVESVESAPEPGAPLILATAIPKGKRWQLLVEKCTELGVAALRPVLWERSVAEGAGDPQKWHRWALEACKQSRRLAAPDIDTPVSLPALLAEAPAATARRFLACPRGTPPTEAFSADAANRTGGHTSESGLILIGPEGGVTEEERSACLDAGCRPVCLGPHILRVETAAMAAAALWAGVAGHPNPSR